MSEYIIRKQIDFCYGHRVWSQELLEDYALTTHCKCRHLHGHQGKILIGLSANELKNGMVVDFNNINFFKQYVDKYLDHKFIMDINDPLIEHEIPLLTHLQPSDALQEITDMPGLWEIRPTLYTNLTPAVKEKYEGMVFVNFVPTSENLCKWLYDVVAPKMREINVTCHSIEFFETPKSSCVYTG